MGFGVSVFDKESYMIYDTILSNINNIIDETKILNDKQIHLE